MSDLIPKHGGYRKLKTYQIALLIFDVTVRFCERYIDRFSRTRDQMIQAEKAGLQRGFTGLEKRSEESNRTATCPSEYLPFRGAIQRRHE